MSRSCEVCGKTSVVGNRITRSGSPKYKGGIGLHTGGITKRRFYPNVQKIKVIVDGTVRRMRVCSRCLKAGKVQRPPARPNQIKRAAEAEARRLAEEAAEAARIAAAEAEAAAEAREDLEEIEAEGAGVAAEGAAAEPAEAPAAAAEEPGKSEELAGPADGEEK